MSRSPQIIRDSSSSSPNGFPHDVAIESGKYPHLFYIHIRPLVEIGRWHGIWSYQNADNIPLYIFSSTNLVGRVSLLT